MPQVSTERISLEAATLIWQESPQATVFTQPVVAGKFFDEVHWWGSFRGGRLVAAWPVALDEAGRPTSSDWFYFFGPIWDGRSFPPLARRALSDTLPVYEGFIEAFVSRYGGFVASLPPPQFDVRSFTWWRYSSGSPICVEPRYSARLTALSQKSWQDVLAGMRRDRRPRLRRPVTGGVEWTTDVDPDEVRDLYVERTPVDPLRAGRDATRLLGLTEDGHGFVSAARDLSGRLIAAAVVLHDGVMGNLVIDSVAEDWRKSGLTIHSTARAINKSQEVGLSCFDFNGANSPARGDDKHSYGAEPVLYFDVSFSEV